MGITCLLSIIIILWHFKMSAVTVHQEDASNVCNSLIVFNLASQLQYIAVSETIIISFGS